MIKYIESEQDFNTDVLESKDIILVDFFATWCGPCNMLSPILEEISKEDDKIKICKVDIDKCSTLAVKYEIEFVPTMLIFKNGENISRIDGLTDKNEILEHLKNY